MEEETLTLKPHPPTSDEEGDPNHDADTAMADLLHQNPNSPPNSGSDSDSDSDSDSEDDEAQDNLQLQTLENDLAINPSNYDAHVQYIKLLRKIGDIEKLRRAREAMSELFPLTPAMWQDWARDESSLIAGTESFSAIEKLYERGVSDYLSTSLWSDYLAFIQEYDPSVRECSPAGISKARDLFERALTATGLHVAEGNKIWEAYREFEQAILHAIDEADIQAIEKQVQRIRSIFHRQLAVPLVNMRSTLLVYKAWEAEQGSILNIESDSLDGVSSHVASAYQKALDVYNARVHLEEKISRQDIPDLERLQEFMNYVKFEQSSGDPARVQILFDRAITEFPVSSDLWLDYTRYLDRTLKVGSAVTNVHSRAIKNCPWVGELWVRYLLSLERNRASEKEIFAVFEKALRCTFSTLDEYLDLFLTRVDGLRRRIISNEDENVLHYSLIRETFQNASDYLSPHLKNTEAFVRLHAYWARLELRLGKDLVPARGVWESLLKICGSMLEAWQGYIAMEIELGHVKEARSIYKRCYSKRFPGTGSEDICHSWLRFEREFGTLEDLDHAAQKVSHRLEELQLFRSREESKLAERENISKKNIREKRKPVSDIADEQFPAKRKKDAGDNLKKVHEKDKAQLQKLDEENKREEIKTQANEPDIKKEEQTKDSIPEKARVYTDQCTAFISNLHLKANVEDLRKFFSDVGGVVGIRILRDKFTGKSRGLAYVDFSDDSHLAAAVAKTKQTLLGKKLSIARSDPKRGKRDPSGRSFQGAQEHDADQTDVSGGSLSKDSVGASKQSSAPQVPPSTRKPRVDTIQLKGKNTFAVPRNVSALYQTAKKPETEEDDDEKPKSNDEFRKMFIKG